MTVEEITYNALKNDAELVSLLADGVNSIYNGQSPDAGTYPVIVFRLLTASPALHSDNEMGAFRATVRVTAITGNGATAEIRQLIYNAMIDSGFKWAATNKVYNDEECYLVMDFNYVTEVSK